MISSSKFYSVFASLLVFGSVTGFSQNASFHLRGYTGLQEGDVKATYHNIPHIGNMSNLYAEYPISFNESSYFHFSSLIVGAKVESQTTGEKLALTIPSAYKSSPDYSESWTFNPLEGYSKATHMETLARASDPDTWPDSWAGEWKGYFGNNVTRSSEELMFVSSDETMTAYIDQYQPFDDEPELGGLGIHIKTHIFAWNTSATDTYAAMRNTHVVIHDITNTSDKNIDSLFIGNWVADLINSTGSDDQIEIDSARSAVLFYDGTGTGVAAIQLLDQPSSALMVNEVNVGSINLDDDEETYTIFTEYMGGLASGDTDITISTLPFSLLAHESTIVAYAYSIQEEAESTSQNKEDLKARMDYIKSSYESDFTKDALDEIPLADDQSNLELKLDISAVDSMVNLEDATVNAIITREYFEEKFALRAFSKISKTSFDVGLSFFDIFGRLWTKRIYH